MVGGQEGEDEPESSIFDSRCLIDDPVKRRFTRKFATLTETPLQFVQGFVGWVPARQVDGPETMPPWGRWLAAAGGAETKGRVGRPRPTVAAMGRGLRLAGDGQPYLFGAVGNRKVATPQAHQALGTRHAAQPRFFGVEEVI